MNMKRMRGRNHRPGGGGGPIRHHNGNIPLNRNHVFDSSGPDLRVRGTAQQLFEKYLQLGRDATSSGDRVSAEGYFQHAEHYFRILNAIAQAAQQQQAQNGQNQNQNRENNHGGQNRYRRDFEGSRDGEYGREGEAPRDDDQRQEGRSDEAASERPATEYRRDRNRDRDRDRDAAPAEDPSWREADAPADA
ncbi:MAG: DUF4167 domain-containing protein [Gluconacetobacter diazotrophicus]|nr:DUF4167 domain-containing protein [Gluconacetobacter diazotrophicus]